MAFVFGRRLAIPLGAMAFFTVALTAPPPADLFPMPPTLLISAAVGMAMAYWMSSAVPWPGMRTARPLVIALGLLLGSHVAFAQDMSRYRAYVLESSLDSVVAASGARGADAKTLHERPATIQQLEWRAPYVDSRDTQADPVRDISFTFYNDALYQVIVTYDRDRTEGLTNSDIVEKVSATYGIATLASPKARMNLPAEAFPESTVVARWENADSQLTLIRGSYSREFQLVLISKALSARARSAVREATRLDAIDAPRRQAELRKKEDGDAIAARDKTRITNKAAFRP